MLPNDTSPPVTVALTCSAPDRLAEAEALAARLGIPRQPPEAPLATDFLLRLTPTHLELVNAAEPRDKPVCFDFVHGELSWRRLHGGGEAVVKAIGGTAKARPSVLDATAGMGRDGFVLACAGCRVLMVERSPIVHALLDDALARAAADPDLGPLIRTRLTLVQGEAPAVMAGLPEDLRPDVVYLDPMYPHRKKSALVKKEMRVFRALVGEDTDADALLPAALACARKKVVVKRPDYADPLAGDRPNTAITTKTHRFDIYLKPAP